MRLIVSGSRERSDRRFIREVLDQHTQGERQVTLVTGACPTGVDRIAEAWAEIRGWDLELFHPDWTLGPRGGPLRNERMIRAGGDLLLAFPLGLSPGTRGTIRLAEKAGIPVCVYDPGGGR